MPVPERPPKGVNAQGVADRSCWSLLSIDFPGLWCRSSVWKIKGNFCFPIGELKVAHDLPIECYKFASGQSWIDAQSLGFRKRLRTPARYVPDWSGCIRTIPPGNVKFYSRFGDIDLIFLFRGSDRLSDSLLYLEIWFGIPDLQDATLLKIIFGSPSQVGDTSSQTPTASPSVYASLAQLAQLEKGWKDCSPGVHLQSRCTDVCRCVRQTEPSYSYNPTEVLDSESLNNDHLKVWKVGTSVHIFFWRPGTRWFKPKRDDTGKKTYVPWKKNSRSLEKIFTAPGKEI